MSNTKNYIQKKEKYFETYPIFLNT